jgi:hypothetical protein
VVYRAATEFAPPGRRKAAVLPGCETSLVWPGHIDNPALARFVRFVQEQGLSHPWAQ